MRSRRKQVSWEPDDGDPAPGGRWTRGVRGSPVQGHWSDLPQSHRNALCLLLLDLHLTGCGGGACGPLSDEVGQRAPLCRGRAGGLAVPAALHRYSPEPHHPTNFRGGQKHSACTAPMGVRGHQTLERNLAVTKELNFLLVHFIYIFTGVCGCLGPAQPGARLLLS